MKPYVITTGTVFGRLERTAMGQCRRAGLCAQRAVGPLWVVGRSRVTVTRFNFTFVARR